MTDKELTRLCKQKDKSGQKALYEKKYRLIYRIAYRYVIHHQDTEDVVLTVFNQVFKNIDKFEYRGENSLNNWITKITVNESNKRLRLKKPEVYLGGNEELAKLEKQTQVDLGTESVEMLNNILKNMPLGYKTVFLMKTVEEYSHQTISEILGISRNTSKSQLIKARKFILAQLKEVKNG